MRRAPDTIRHHWTPLDTTRSTVSASTQVIRGRTQVTEHVPPVGVEPTLEPF